MPGDGRRKVGAGGLRCVSSRDPYLARLRIVLLLLSEQSVALSAIGDLIRMLNPVVHRDIPPSDISCPPLAQSGDIREWERKVAAGTEGAGHSSRSSRDRSVMIVEGCAYILLTSGDGGSFSLDVCPRLSHEGAER